MSNSFRYAPQVFLQPDEDNAKAVILTPEQGLTPEERWVKETEWLSGGARPRIAFDTDGLVLDYGCGIGRVAKRLRQPVLGVDISSTMRAQAEGYVARSNFGCVSPPMLAELERFGLRCQGAVAVWVLQHCRDVQRDIHLIAAVLAKGASFIVVNRRHRAVPVTNGNGLSWWDDGVDIDEILGGLFIKTHEEPVPESLCAPGAFLTHWRRNNAEPARLS